MTAHSFSETAIIIPVHNEAPALPKLFDALADCQALVIFVDNASTDNSYGLIKDPSISWSVSIGWATVTPSGQVLLRPSVLVRPLLWSTMPMHRIK